MNRFGAAVVRWVDTCAVKPEISEDDEQAVDWVRILPFVFMHVMCLGVFFVGWSPVAVGTALVLYLVRMFAITGFYHRYFSHNAIKASRC